MGNLIIIPTFNSHQSPNLHTTLYNNTNNRAPYNDDKHHLEERKNYFALAEIQMRFILFG